MQNYSNFTKQDRNRTDTVTGSYLITVCFSRIRYAVVFFYETGHAQCNALSGFFFKEGEH